MKKLISVFLAVLLVLSLSLYALGDENLPNYKWEHVEKIVQDTFGSNGNVYQIKNIDASIWLPGEYISVDPVQEGLGPDCLGLFLMGDSFVLINYTDPEGLDLNSYYDYSIQQGLQVEKVLVNDIPAILQDNPQEDSFLLMFQTQENKFLQFIFSPLSNPVNGIIMSSIQSTVAQEPTPVESSSESTGVSEPAAPTNPVSGLIYK